MAKKLGRCYAAVDAISVLPEKAIAALNSGEAKLPYTTRLKGTGNGTGKPEVPVIVLKYEAVTKSTGKKPFMARYRGEGVDVNASKKFCLVKFVDESRDWLPSDNRVRFGREKSAMAGYEDILSRL